MKDKILPLMKDKATGKNYVFQQDSAPAHTAKRTIKFLKRSNVRFWKKDRGLRSTALRTSLNNQRKDKENIHRAYGASLYSFYLFASVVTVSHLLDVTN